MKKTYTAPTLEVEIYELDQSIASNCGIVVSNGPAEGSHEACEDYVAPFSLRTTGVYNVSFYEDTNCDCYTTGQDSGYWTS